MTTVEMPKDLAHYRFKNLNFPERATILLVYLACWKRFVSKAALLKDQSAYFSLYFKELHVRYYESVVKGPKFVSTVRLKKNFMLSRTNENMRLVLQSFNPLNLASFIHGIRSQIELNSLVSTFVRDDKYLKEFILLNEDRTKVNEVPTVKNVNTLVHHLDKELSLYRATYDMLSNLLHPNPSAVKFYAQAKKTKSLEETSVMSPSIKYFFHETISEDADTINWFRKLTWSFLAYIEHFLILFDQLGEDFGRDESENLLLWETSAAEILLKSQTALVNAFNTSQKSGANVETAIQEKIDEILRKGRNENQ